MTTNLHGIIKVLSFDLETAGVNAFYADLGYIVCFGYKWLHEDTVHCLNIADYPLFKVDPHNDRDLCKDALAIYEQADHIVVHYGVKFDKKFFQSRCMKHGMVVPAVRTTDTCYVSRNVLKLNSNRLANLANFLEVPVKKQAKGDGWPKWWMYALKGSTKYMPAMSDYCMDDVVCMEGCYKKLRPYIRAFDSAVNYNIVTSNPVCPACGQNALQKRGRRITTTAIFQRYWCRKCQAYSQDSVNEAKQKPKNQLKLGK